MQYVMKTALFLVLLACFSHPTTTRAQSFSATSEKAIRNVLDTQVQAWNTGNIEEFMQGYWQSDSLRFASGGNVKRGWKTTLERYQKSYPNKAAMGKLTFSNLEMTMLAPDAALVFGRWQLQREKDTPGGLFTLTFRKIGNDWKIIHDHTSSGN